MEMIQKEEVVFPNEYDLFPAVAESVGSLNRYGQKALNELDEKTKETPPSILRSSRHKSNWGQNLSDDEPESVKVREYDDLALGSAKRSVYFTEEFWADRFNFLRRDGKGIWTREEARKEVGQEELWKDVLSASWDYTRSFTVGFQAENIVLHQFPDLRHTAESRGWKDELDGIDLRGSDGTTYQVKSSKGRYRKKKRREALEDADVLIVADTTRNEMRVFE